MSKELVKSTGFLPTVFDEFFRPWNEWFDNGNFAGRILNVPAVNIAESKDSYSLSLAVPGMKKTDFKIDVDGNILTISAEKEEKKEEKDKRYNRTEYNYSSFSRSFTVPDGVKKEDIHATYDNGVLTLLLPKKEEVKKAVVTKSIAVK
jgi:HSP20 family protein